MWFNANNDGQLFWTGINDTSGDRLNIFFSEDGGLGGNTTTPQIHYTFKGHTHYANVNPNQWHHLVCTYSGTNSSNRKIYIDGVETGADTATDGTGDTTHALNIQTSTFYLNKTNYGNGSLVGSISNFKLYNVALEPSEVKKLYNLGRTGRSMVISDTAVGIGKVPEAQLDVRGDIIGGCPVYFQRTAGQNTATNTTFNFNRVAVSKGGGWNDTSKFYAPIAGYYHISFSCMSTYGPGVHAFRFRKNGSDHPGNNEDARVYGYINNPSGAYGYTYMRLAGSTIMYLAVGDYMDILNEPGTSSIHISYNQLTGFYLSI
jgi:hypothetical protein